MAILLSQSAHATVRRRQLRPLGMTLSKHRFAPALGSELVEPGALSPVCWRECAG
jgi:hypothetical protein